MTWRRSSILVVLLSGLPAWLPAAPVADNEPLKPVPSVPREPAGKVALGKRLFNDRRLSGNQTLACSTCHAVGSGGADPRGHSPGVTGQDSGINAPTVLNAALNFRQFWDGRAADLKMQVDDVVQNPMEMGARWPQVIAMLHADAGYVTQFAEVYPDGVTATNVRDALACYERTLLTPGSRFDRYLQGDEGAISGAEKAGYDAFKQYGCAACHQGVNVGGNMFQKFGVMGDYFAARGAVTQADLGRYNVTGDPDDRYVFKVPGLRNVARTAPYFHDGSAPDLEHAVDVMFRYQLGRVPDPQDKAAIILFLRTLTADPPEAVP